MATLRTDRKFLADNVADVVVASANTGVFPSVKMAQAILETGWGKSDHAKSNINNYYGIKADPSWKGKVVSSDTSEVVNGKRQYFTGTGKIYKNRDVAIADGASTVTLFRVYSTAMESHADHIHFLKVNSRYTNNGVFSATTAEAQAQALQTAGYATATSYASTLIQIINDNGLKELDSMMSNPSKLKKLVAEVKKKSSAEIELQVDMPQQVELELPCSHSGCSGKIMVKLEIKHS